MEVFSNIFNFLFNFWNNYGLSVLFSSILVVCGQIAVKILNPLVEKAFFKINVKDRFIVSMVKKTLQISLWIFIVGLILNSFNISFASVMLSMSPLFLVIGFGFKSFINNFIKSIQLKILNPYQVGDEIEVDGIRGTVEQVDFFYTYLNTIDGGFTTIANSQIADKRISNFTHNNKDVTTLKDNNAIVISPKADIIKQDDSNLK